MSARANAGRPTNTDPLLAANARSAGTSPSGDASITLPGLRTRPVVVDHSLAAQWRGTAGRSHNPSSYIGESQRLWLLLCLFLLAALLVVCSLHFTESTHEHVHPTATLPPDHPHMLKRAAMALAAGTNGAVLRSLPAATASSAYSVIYVTSPSAEVSAKLSTGLLESKLVACATVVPGVTSQYWWQGKIESATEQLLMLKTRSSLFPLVADYVKQNHPYETPEIVQLPIEQGNKPYLDWISVSTKDPSEL